MKYKLIALDIDGTLLNDQHQLSELTKQTVRRVHDEGATIVLCSGRAPQSVFPILDQLGLDGTIIAHNGASTVLSEGHKLVHDFSFPTAEYEKLFEYLRLKDIHFDASTPFDLYVESATQEELDIYAQFFVTPNIIPDIMQLPRLVKMTLAAEVDLIEEAERVLRENDMIKGLNMFRSGLNFIDLVHDKATKGNALKDLADQMGIAHDQIIAIGNYYNDVEMIEFAGLGIAMGNSPDDLKNLAQDVTLSNNEDGVAQALIKYCLS
jgi:Cof subfamily protein (haloacid dehalogenase superfamily)